MIKQLKKYDVQNTPFIATKAWELLNIQQQDLALVESGDSIVFEFIDYSYTHPQGLLSTAFTLGLEQQTVDPVIYEEGISGSGIFYPEKERKNLTGTYTRLLYQQVLRAFYNNYQNPLKIFGIDDFDFQTSEMYRFLSNYFRIFKLDQHKFGDRIAKGSVEFVDNTFDDNYRITDDSQGNLIAWPNLFSKVQEVRHIANDVRDGSAGYDCPLPITGSPESPFLLTGSLTGSAAVFALPYLSALSWSYSSSNADGFTIYKKFTLDGATWSPFTALQITPTNITWSSDVTTASVASASYYVTAYNTLGESSGSNIITFSPPA